MSEDPLRQKRLRFLGAAGTSSAAGAGAGTGEPVGAAAALPPIQAGACSTHSVQRHFSFGRVSILRLKADGGLSAPHEEQRSASAAAGPRGAAAVAAGAATGAAAAAGAAFAN